jgi:phytoene dehydrogenase-like protein
LEVVRSHSLPRYDVVIVGAGLGGLTAAAILARTGQKVLVIERSNSVGGAASSYKVGDLFVEGSLHETSNPRNVADPKHDALSRAGVLDAVNWSPSGTFYEVRGGPLKTPLTLPDSFSGAREALIGRFPEARNGINRVLREIEQMASVTARALAEPLSLQQMFDRAFGDNEAVKCAFAANLCYYHDDPATLSWRFFAEAQGHYLRNGACFINGGSQRLSSALARAVKTAGGDVILRRTVSAIIPSPGGLYKVGHVAKDGSDPQTIETMRVVSNAAPESTAALLPETEARQLRAHYADQAPSISVFALTLGLSQPPREFGVTCYSTQLLPTWMSCLADYGQGTSLLADEPGARMPPLAIVDYAAIASGVPAPPYVLSIIGPDRLSNWEAGDTDAYRAKRTRWQQAIIRYLDSHYRGLAAAVTATSFNSALSVWQYLGSPEGAVYGFAPTPSAADDTVARSPRTSLEGLYLSSAYANFGGYNGVIQGGAACADVILSES